LPFDSIIRLRAGGLVQLENLLLGNNLPAEDCAEQVQNFYGIFDGADLIAAGGLEPAANVALLRSVVVHEQYRGRGLGKSIIEHLIRFADSEGRESVYLLTETAGAYFENLGFKRIDRIEVPPAIASTRQFTSLCPDTASCLKMTFAAPR